MKKWHRILALALAICLPAPLVFTGCIDPGSLPSHTTGTGGTSKPGGSSGGGGTGGSSGGSSGSSGSGTTTPGGSGSSGTGSGTGGSGTDIGGDENFDISLADFFAGSRLNYVVTDATKDEEYLKYVEKAKQSTDQLAKDILYRLGGEYIWVNDKSGSRFTPVASDKTGVDMDTKKDKINYTASENKYLEGYNSKYDIAFKDYSEGESTISISLFDCIKKYYNDPEDKQSKIQAIMHITENFHHDYYYTDENNKPNIAETSDLYPLEDSKQVMINVASNQVCLLLDYEHNEKINEVDEEYHVIGFSVLNYDEFVDMMNRPDNDENGVHITSQEDRQKLDDLFNYFPYDTETTSLSHKVVVGNGDQVTNWEMYKKKFTSLDEFVDTNYETVSKAILAILSGLDLTESKNNALASSIKNKTYEELVKNIDHYGIVATNDDGSATNEVVNIVKYILKYCIGDSLVSIDQSKIYKFENGEYVRQNQGSYDYDTTVRYNDSNINNLSMNEYGILAQKYNMYNESKGGASFTTGEPVQYGVLSFFTFDTILVDKYMNDNNYLNSDEWQNLGLSTNGYVENDTGFKYAVDYGFKNYINTVETIVSTVCNATMYEENIKKPISSKDGAGFVYNYVPNIYEYVKSGIYTALVSNSVMDIDVDNGEYANYAPMGEQHYQSLVMYPSKQFSFSSVILTFESTLGVNNMDLFLRYHKAGTGFVKFAVQENGQLVAKDYVKVNGSNWNIPKGKVESLDENDIREEEIDIAKLLENRCDINKANITTLNNSIVGADNSSVMTAILNVFGGIDGYKKNLVLSAGVNNDSSYPGSTYTQSTFFPAIEVVTTSGEKVTVVGYDNKDEEYIEILFATDDDALFRFAYYLIDVETI